MKLGPTTTEKPPLGVMPRLIWLEQRRDAILDAIMEHRQAQRDIPNYWLDELGKLVREISEEGSRPRVKPPHSPIPVPGYFER